MSSINGFSFDTIQNFDDHIAKSIPNYDLLVESINDQVNHGNTTALLLSGGLDSSLIAYIMKKKIDKEIKYEGSETGKEDRSRRRSESGAERQAKSVTTTMNSPRGHLLSPIATTLNRPKRGAVTW